MAAICEQAVAVRSRLELMDLLTGMFPVRTDMFSLELVE